MQRWMNDILRTARAAAFVVAACALQASGAHARQQTGAGLTRTPPTAESRPSSPSPQARAQASPKLPADPPAVAPNYEAPARALPSIERIGVEVGEPLALTLGEAVRLALENNNDIEATRIDVTVAEHDLTAARGAYDLRFTSESYFERSETPVASYPRGRQRWHSDDDRRDGPSRLRGAGGARGRVVQIRVHFAQAQHEQRIRRHQPVGL